jgi:hypothetical protein
MHYSSGMGLVVSVVGGFSVTGDRPLSVATRVLLDAAGLCFGLYLLTVAALALTGHRLHRQATADQPPPRTARHRYGPPAPTFEGTPR